MKGENKMKANRLKRPISWLLVFVMVLTLCPTVALAGDTLPYTGESALGTNEPTSHGYRAEDLLSWDPATDPDAELLRARVPLQSRIEAVAATQANPTLNPEVEYLTLAGDYGNAFFGGTSYTNEFSEYVFNFCSISTTTPPGMVRPLPPPPSSCGTARVSARVPPTGRSAPSSSA